VVKLGPREKGKQVVGKRESKRAKAEEVDTPPDLIEVSPKGLQDNKQREGMYRYNYSAWKDVKPPHNPWLVRGNRAGLYMKQGPLWVRVPPVVETCRKVYGGRATSAKIQAFELYVPLPGGRVHKCPSMKAMWGLCYSVVTSAMFATASAAERIDLARLWQNRAKARVADSKAAIALLDRASQDAETPPVDIFGTAEEVTVTTPSPSRSPTPTPRPTPRPTPAAQPQTEAQRAAAAVIPTPAVRPARERRVGVNPEFPTAYTIEEPPSEEERRGMSVSVPALSGPEHAATHPSVDHITDTLVRMGYLKDFRKGVFLLRDPLEDEAVGRRNKVAKHIKSRADAEEAMLVLCRERMMELIGNNLFRVLHSEEDEETAGRVRSSPDTVDSQPSKKKPKQTQAKPKVRKSVKSEPAQSANLYDANNPKLRALLAGLPASQVGNRETGVHKAPRIDNSGPNPACLINGKVLPVILLDYGSESAITGRAGARQMGLKPSMMDLGAVALRVADGGTTKAFNMTKQPVEFVFNPKTPDETKVLSHVIVVNSENADTLLGMSVLGKIGLTANPYKGRVKYYVNWKEPNPSKAYLKSTFPVDRPSPACAASSSGQVIEVVNAASAVHLPLPLDSPRNGFATTSTQFRLRAHRSQLTPELTSLMYRSKQALTISEPVQPTASDPYGHLRPLDARLVDIFSMPAAQEEGLVVVELFLGISATTDERNYSSYYGECLAAVWAVSYFRIYLYGRPFVLKTDHEPLKWLMTSKKLTGMHARWASILQEYDVDIQHRAGVTHGDADGLLRNPLPSEEDRTDARMHHDSPVTSVEAGLALLVCLGAEAIKAAASQPKFGGTEKDGDPQATESSAANSTSRDVWQDSASIAYLRTGSHAPEQTGPAKDQNQHRAKHYYFENDLLRKRMPAGIDKIVAEPHLRANLIRATHLDTGHYGIKKRTLYLSRFMSGQVCTSK
jgi:hypothetical protein